MQVMNYECTSEVWWAVLAMLYVIPQVHGAYIIPQERGAAFHAAPSKDQHIRDSRRYAEAQEYQMTQDDRKTSRLQNLKSMADLIDLMTAFKHTSRNIFNLLSRDHRKPKSRVNKAISLKNEIYSHPSTALLPRPSNYLSSNFLFPFVRRNTQEIEPYKVRANDYSGGSVSIPSKRRTLGLAYGCDLRKVTLNIMIEYLKSGRICGTPVSHVRFGLGRK